MPPLAKENAALSVGASLANEIKRVPHFRDSQYVNLDVAATIDYFKRKFVDHIYLSPLTPNDILADIGAGYGWLAMALGAHTPCRVIGVDVDRERLSAAKSIAELLGLGERIDWRVGGIQKLPLATQEADLAFCIEVLEHVQRDPSGFAELDRCTRRFLVITTPNGAFPVVSHDTCLPFCHWLPPRLRDIYARPLGRLQMQQGNRFWTPWDFSKHLSAFRRVSSFLHYKNVDDYFALFPYYLPYGRGEWRQAPSPFAHAILTMLSKTGKSGHYFIRSLAGTFERQSNYVEPKGST
jgi:SAM-dependent methyltransferase